MDTHAEWKDIDYRSLPWKEIRLNTEIIAMPLADKKQDNLSCLRIFTLDVPLAWKLCLAGPRSLPGCSILQFRAACWCHLLRTLPGLITWSGPVTFLSLYLIFFITITHPSFLGCLLFLCIVSLPHPYPKLAYLLAATGLRCPIEELLATCGHWLFEMWWVQIKMGCYVYNTHRILKT